MNLIDYIKGQRKGKDAHRLEREAMQYPFLADALDGYDAVEGNHAERIETLQKQLLRRSSRRARKKLWIGVVASLLIVLTVGGYWWISQNPERYIAQSEIPLSEEEVDLEIAMEAEEPLENECNPSQIPESAAVLPVEKSKSSVARKVHSETPVDLEIVDELLVSEEEEGRSAQILSFKKDTLITAQHVATERDEDLKDDRSVVVSSDSQVMRRASAEVLNGVPVPVIGMKAYRKYLEEKMIRPTSGDCANKKGKVLLSFQIDADGRPVNLKIVKGLCSDLDQESLRLVKDGCQWRGSTKDIMMIEVIF